MPEGSTFAEKYDVHEALNRFLMRHERHIDFLLFYITGVWNKNTNESLSFKSFTASPA